MKIPVVAAGRGSPSVLSGQAEAEEPPETMIGLYKGSRSPEPSAPSDVDWVGLSDGTGSRGTPTRMESRGEGGSEWVQRHLCSDVVLVSARVGRGFSWSDCERLFRELRGEGRLLLGVLAGPYFELRKTGEGIRRSLREIPDFFLPVNTPSVVASLEEIPSTPDANRVVSEYLGGIVKTLRTRLRHSDGLTRGLCELLEMTRREKITLLKIGLAKLRRNHLLNRPS